MTLAQIPASRILPLPGWLNSDPQYRHGGWERLHGYRRIEEDDWPEGQTLLRALPAGAT